VEEPAAIKDDPVSDFLDPPDYEFNLFTSPDAAGTQYENGNRTWFYFSIRGPLASRSVRLNIMNLNRQSRLYNQGLSPFYRSSCSKTSSWQRVKERVAFEVRYLVNFKHINRY